jgi:hypothetical protein
MKDEESLHLDQTYCVHYYSKLDSADGREPDFFGGLQPTNLYRDNEAFEKVQKYLHLLMQFNIYVDVGLEGGYVQKLNRNIFCLNDGKLIDI